MKEKTKDPKSIPKSKSKSISNPKSLNLQKPKQNLKIKKSIIRTITTLLLTTTTKTTKQIPLTSSEPLEPNIKFNPKDRCPEGCYSCVFSSQTQKTPSNTPSKTTPPLECEGCWHNRLGLEGCPPLSVKQKDCLLYHKTGICVICSKGKIPKTFKTRDNVLSSKCVKSFEKSVIWGFYDHTTKNSFYRVCEGKFPIYKNKYCKPFQKGDFISKNCVWGSGHKGCQKCFKCRKGFTSFYGVCRPSWRGIEGCVYADDEEFCSYCDHWDGFYMDYPGHCARYQEQGERGVGGVKKCVSEFLRFRNRVFMAFQMFD